MNGRRLLPFFVLPLVVACAQVALTPAPPSMQDPKSLWQQRRQQLGEFINWELKGRLAVRTDGRGDSASLIWKRNDVDQEIQLFGAFGGGQLRMTEAETGAVLRDGAGQEFHGRTAQEVLYRAVAWHVPFAKLGYWVRGLAAPGRHEGIGFDREGRTRQLSQSGWEIEYLEYRKFDGLELPRRIEIRALPRIVQALKNDGMESGELLSVKLVIGYWSGGPGAG